MMNKSHCGFFFILLILLASEMVEQIDGWGCKDLNCLWTCRAQDFPFGVCTGLLIKSCKCLGERVLE
ncbi:hypothetical protein P8452_23189 [Trifolium repens]|nr:hypothetical protein P8452_23189 [Trifolium repens]